jgi:hypothetical protein
MLGGWWIAKLDVVAPPPARTTPEAEPVPPQREPRAQPAPDLTVEDPATSPRTTSGSPATRTRISPDASEDLLLGRIVDSSNAPIAGARIDAVRLGATELAHLGDPELRAEELAVAASISGSDGRFEIRLEIGRLHRLAVAADGFASTARADVQAGDDLTIVLRRGASVSGRVTRKEDEVPVAGARVAIERSGDLLLVWEGTSDDAGRFSAQGIDPGQADLVVVPVEECRERTALDLREGDAVVLDVQVPFGLIVTGQVKSRETGEPIAGAEVGSEAFREKIATTDEAGRFELTGLLEAPVLVLSARAAGFGAFETVLRPGVDRILTANFELTRGRVARGRAVDRGGRPIAGAYVAALSRSADGDVARTDRVSGRTGADGRFRIAGLRTDLPHTLLVRREGLASCLVRAFDARPEAEFDLGDLVLRPGSSLSGRLVSPDGQPIPDAWLDLATSAPGDSDPNLGLGRRSLRTASGGRFHFLDLPPGHHVLQAFVTGLETEVKAEFDLAEGEAKRGVEVVAGSGRMIRGRVLGPEGRGLEGADLLLRKAGEERGTSAFSGSDGSFLFASLAEGSYDLGASYAEAYVSPTGPFELAGASLSGVRAGTSGLVLELRRGAEITGQVVSPQGKAFAFARVVAIDGKGARLDGRNADEAGRFRLRVAADAVVELRAWRTGVDPATGRGLWADETRLPEALQSGVHAGELEIELVIAP